MNSSSFFLPRFNASGHWACKRASQRQLHLSTVGLLGRGHGQPAKGILTEIGLPGKTEYLRIEANGINLPFMMIIWRIRYF